MRRLMLAVTLIALLGTQLLHAADFDIEKFSDPTKYGWKTPEQQKTARQQLLQRHRFLQLYNQKKQNPWQNALKSSLAPGWGHFSVESYTKGQVFLGLQVVLLGSSWYFHDQAMEQYDRYKKATQIDQINQYYNDAITPYRYFQGFMALWFVVWTYTLYDAARDTERYNANLWKNISRSDNNETSLRLQFTPTGITLKF